VGAAAASWENEERSSFLKKRSKRLLFLRWWNDTRHELQHFEVAMKQETGFASSLEK
jgi:hypothetical protein